MKKVNLLNDLKLERKQAKDNNYNYVGSSNHWLSLDEQKIKTKEIESITKDKSD